MATIMGSRSRPRFYSYRSLPIVPTRTNSHASLPSLSSPPQVVAPVPAIAAPPLSPVAVSAPVPCVPETNLCDIMTIIDDYLAAPVSTSSRSFHSFQPKSPLSLHGISHAQYISIAMRVDALAAASVGFAKSTRLSYDSSTGVLVLAGPSLAHEVVSKFTDKIHQVIEANNHDFYGDWKTDTTRRILSTGSHPVAWKNGPLDGTRAPDGSLRLQGAPIPFLVVEVADTQSRKHLLQLAAKYILGSASAVHLVILIKLERRKPISRKRKQAPENTPIHPSTNAAATDAVSPTDPPPEPVDHNPYTHGYLWVYNYTVTPSTDDPAVSDLEVVCVEAEHEFYPTPSTSHLTLTWHDILPAGRVPEHVASKTVQIPYSVLMDLLVAAQAPELPDFSSQNPPATKIRYDWSVLNESSSEFSSSDGSVQEEVEDESDPSYSSMLGKVGYEDEGSSVRVLRSTSLR